MLITNGKIVSWGQNAEIMEGKALRLQDGLIEAIAEESLLRSAYPEDAILDAGGQLVMAGNICAHTHFYGAARAAWRSQESHRGFPIHLKAYGGSWIRRWMKMPRYSALVCLVDAIKYGTTTLFDHHASPNSLTALLISSQRLSARRVCGLRYVTK